MKKITFLVASIFLAGSMAVASENPVFSDNKQTKIGSFCFDEPIEFNERGIEFYVFPNGDFDFNTRPDATTNGGYYFKGAGKRGSKMDDRGLANYGVRIERDYFGRIRRVGNTFINYDAFDRVNRIGTVFMRYNSFALSQIGGLRIVYNRRGDIVDMVGSVKGYRSGYSYGNTYNNPHTGYSNDGYYYKNSKGEENYPIEDENGYLKGEDHKEKDNNTLEKDKRR